MNTSVASPADNDPERKRPPKPVRPPGPVARPKQVAWLLGIHVATVYAWAERYADFPKSKRLGPRTAVFDTAEVIAWRDRRGVAP